MLSTRCSKLFGQLWVLALLTTAAGGAAHFEPRFQYGVYFRNVTLFNPSTRHAIHDFQLTLPRLEHFTQSNLPLRFWVCEDPNIPSRCFKEELMEKLAKTQHKNLEEDLANLGSFLEVAVPKINENIQLTSIQRIDPFGRERNEMHSTQSWNELKKRYTLPGHDIPEMTNPRSLDHIEQARLYLVKIQLEHLDEELEQSQQALSRLSQQVSDRFLKVAARIYARNKALMDYIFNIYLTRRKVLWLRQNIEVLITQRTLPQTLVSMEDLNMTQQMYEGISKYPRFKYTRRPLTSFYKDEVKVYRDDLHLRLLLHVPLNSVHLQEAFTLYRVKVFPLLWRRGSNNYTLTLTDVPSYLAVSRDNEHYVTMTEHDYASCRGDPVLSCDQVLAISSKQVASCLWGVYSSNHTMVAQECRYILDTGPLSPVLSILHGWYILTGVDSVKLRPPPGNTSLDEKTAAGCSQCVRSYSCDYSLVVRAASIEHHMPRCYSVGVSGLSAEDISVLPWLSQYQETPTVVDERKLMYMSDAGVTNSKGSRESFNGVSLAVAGLVLVLAAVVMHVLASRRLNVQIVRILYEMF